MACVASCSDRPESSFQECTRYENMQSGEELGTFVTNYINSIVKTAVMGTLDTSESDEGRQKLEQIDSLYHQDLTQVTSLEGTSDIENNTNANGWPVRRTKSEQPNTSEGDELGPVKSTGRKIPRDKEKEGAKTASSATDEVTETRVSSCHDKGLHPSKADDGDQLDPVKTMHTLQREVLLVRFPIEKFDYRGPLRIHASLATCAAVNKAIRDAASKVSSNEPDETKRIKEFIRMLKKQKICEKQGGGDKTQIKDNDPKEDNTEVSPKGEDAGESNMSQENELICAAQEQKSTSMCSKATHTNIKSTVSDIESQCESTRAAVNKGIRDAASRVSNEPDETKRVKEFIRMLKKQKICEKQGGGDKTQIKDNDPKEENIEKMYPKVEDAEESNMAQENEMICAAQEKKMTSMCSKATHTNIKSTVSDIESQCESTCAAVNKAIRDAASRVSNEPDETKNVKEFIRMLKKQKICEKQDGCDKTQIIDNDPKEDNTEVSPNVEDAGKSNMSQENEICVAQEEKRLPRTQKNKPCSKTRANITSTVSDIESLCESSNQIANFDRDGEISDKTYMIQEGENGSVAQKKERSYMIHKTVSISGDKSIDVIKEVCYQQKERLTIVKIQRSEEQKEDGDSEYISFDGETEELQHLNAQQDETGYVFVHVKGYTYGPSKKEEEDLEEKTKLSLSIQRILQKLFPSLANAGLKKNQDNTCNDATCLLDSEAVSGNMEKELIKTQKMEQNKGKHGSKLKKGMKKLACCFLREQQQID